MKIFDITLFFIGCFAALTNAGKSGLPYGGSFLSNGKYIPGSIPRIWGPMFVDLKVLVPKCAGGYVQILINLLSDDDKSLKRNDLVSFGLLFKIYRDIFEQLLSFVHHKRTYDVIHEIIEENKDYLGQRPDGTIDLNAVNKFFIRWSNDLNDAINEWKHKN